MTILLHFFNKGSGHAAEVAAAALIAGLWQGIALAAITGLVLRLVPYTTAAVRFVVWVAVFGVSAVIPVAHIFGTAAGPAAAPPQLQADVRWSYLLAGLWAIAAIVRLVLLAAHSIELRSIWKSAVPVEGIEFTQLPAGRPVEVCTSGEVDRPSVIGFLAPRILIPEWLFAQLTEVELRHIVLHELQHLRRRDDWVNLFQKVGLVLFPLNPALFWIDRRLSAERELACDDGVLERTKMPKAYAASLASIAERRLGSGLSRRMAGLALGAFGAGAILRQSELGRRIESILGRRKRLNPALAGGLATVLVVGIVGAAAGMMQVPDLVAFAGGDRAQALAVASSVSGAVVHPEASPLRAIPRAEYRNVEYRFPNPPVRQVSVATKKRAANATPRATKPLYAVQAAEVNRTETRGQQGQLMVLTTWDQPAGALDDTYEVPISRVVVKMPDGRFYVVPYAAVPTQAGWLIVQL